MQQISLLIPFGPSREEGSMVVKSMVEGWMVAEARQQGMPRGLSKASWLQRLPVLPESEPVEIIAQLSPGVASMWR